MRSLLLLPLFALLFASGSLTAQVQKRVLVEHFTQASCPPCANQNPAFNNMLFSNFEKITPIKYQTSWPGYDPMNEQNPEEVAARVSYYGVTGVPNVIMGGTLDVGVAANATAAQINNIHAEMTPIEMEMTHSVSSDLDSMYITCIIRNVSEEEFAPANTVLHVAIVEEELIFPEPPGSTTEADFYYVMRKMLPGANGTPLSSIAAGDSSVVSYAVELPDYIYDYSQLAAVGFVQTNSNKEVHQSDISESLGVPEGYADVAMTLDVQTPDSYCEYEVTPSATIENATDTEVTSLELTMFVNGSATATETWEGALANGESTTIDFGTTAVNPGVNAISFEVTAVNGNPDYNTLNQLENSLNVYTLSEDPFSTEIAEGFETTPNLSIPANTIIENDAPDRLGVVNNSAFGQAGSVGAYGNSNKSIFANFYDWNAPGAQAHLIFEKVDLSNSQNTILTFDYAFAQYGGFATNDRMLVSVSTDCGITWTTVFNEGGASFATAPATNSFFIANADSWASDTIDLSAYDGIPELNLRVSAQTDWGNNLFIDNIGLASGTPVSADEANKLEGKVFAYPNPATDLVNLDFTLVEKSMVTVQVMDVSGKLVQTLAAQDELGVGAHQIQWQPEQAGVYLIRIATQNSALTKRVTVVK